MPLEAPPPAGSTAEAAEFDRLHRALADRYRRFRDDPTLPYTAVVIPSQSMDQRELEKIPGVEHYEERSLFNLMLLRRPRMKVVFVTSKRLNPLIVDYYLHQMRGVPSEHARRRLILLDCDDARPVPLTQKILERPRLMQRIVDSIDDPEMAHIAPFNSSPLERSLSVRLGIPLAASDPALIELGSKSGSRRAFAAAHVPMAPGREGIHTIDDVTAAVTDLWEENRDAKRVVVKLDHGFSGEGNGVLDLRPLSSYGPPHSSTAERRRLLESALPKIGLEAQDLSWDAFAAQLNTMGGICELWVEGENKSSPSTQVRINPVGEVQPVSTHDQVLGGPNGQVFMGATFPARSDYRLMIQEMGVAVGNVLSRKGVLGRFGVDFVVVPSSDGPPKVFAIEINLRQGGTTHPFNTLKSLTDGEYDKDTGVFHTAQGRERCYFATDTLKKAEYRGLLPFDLLDMLVAEGLHFGADETGAVFHLLGCLSEYGKLGGTFIGTNIVEARAIYERTVAMLDRETGD